MTSCPYTHTPSLWPRAPPLHQGPAPQPQNPTPTPRPHPPWQLYLTVVAALTSHTRFAQAMPTMGITGLRPTRGAVTPCKRVAVTVALTPTPASSLPPWEALTGHLLHMHLHPAPSEAPRPSLFITSLLHLGPNHAAACSPAHCARLPPLQPGLSQRTRQSPRGVPSLRRGQSPQMTLGLAVGSPDRESWGPGRVHPVHAGPGPGHSLLRVGYPEALQPRPPCLRVQLPGSRALP